MLTLERISAGYGDATVLRDVSVAVPTGRVVALLGPNGAGKTTLLRVASGLLRPGAGEVRMDGRSLTGRPADDFAGAGVCLIPEGRGIFPSMTVKDNLLLQTGPRQDQNALELATEAFPRLGQRLNQIAGTLSGGEQQMLAVTRAYLSDPAVVMLDEVSLGLAPIIVDEIFSFLAGLAGRGTALLIVEQYVARALAIADFVFLLNQGEIVFAGETREVDEAAVFSAYVGADVA